MTVPSKKTATPTPDAIEDIVTRGDLSKLNAEQRTEYYIRLCNRHGLDPLTQPFDWLMLNNRLTLYANRRCADQLRKNNGININIISQDYADGLLTIHVKAKDKENREDEDLGVVSVPEQLKGDARANAILKCVTKAKRRVTLSISGLGYLDETEVEDIPPQAKSTPIIEPPNPTAAALVEIAGRESDQEVRDKAEPERVISEAMSGQAWRRFGEQMVALAREGKSFTPEQHAKMSVMKHEKPTMWQKMADAIADAQMSRPKEPKVKPKEPKEPEVSPQPKPDDDPDAYRVWLIDQLSRAEKPSDLKDLFDIQRPLWEPCFPPDIEDWESLFKERTLEIATK